MKNFLKTFKEELISLPLIMIAFFSLNGILGALFPHSAFFDFYSQLDTIGFRLVSFAVAIVIAWCGFRIMVPPVFNYFKNEFYQKFETFDDSIKRKYAVAIFITFLLVSALVARSSGAESKEIRADLTKSLNQQLNVRETSPNRGPMVDIYLKSVGISYPAPWCAAFVSYNLQQENTPNPNSAWAPDYGKNQDIIWTAKRGSKQGFAPLPGDVVTYYYPSLHRIGHVGFYIEKDKSGYVITIEGNTNGSGGREGDGVYKKKRDPGQIYAISRFIK